MPTLRQVVPVFPPYDLPVWTSLATGLYPRATGVVGDHMFNLKSRELFSTEDPEASLENWWTGGEPIWSLAAKHGRRVNQHFSFPNLKVYLCSFVLSKVSVLNWHDCTLPGKQLENQDDCKPFDRFEEKKLPTKQLMVRRLNRAITKIHKDDYDLSMVYIDSLKVAAKEHGPNSQQAMDALAEIDQVLQVM